MEYFGNFHVSGVFQSFFRFMGYFGNFYVWGYFCHFLGLGDILVFFYIGFMGSLVIFNFRGYFGNFVVWSILELGDL